jgi:hypothetical protein
MPDQNLYDEDLDQPVAAPGGNEDGADTEKDDTEDVGEPFLAPKASFKGDLSPGTVHRVRIESAHDSELELVCLGEDKGASEPATAPTSDEGDLYT